VHVHILYHLLYSFICQLRCLRPALLPGSARRVIEVVPPGVGQHWDVLSAEAGTPLAEALDTLLGEGAWTMPANQAHGGECPVRHWYCPVVFPEEAPSFSQLAAATATTAATDVDADVIGGRGGGRVRGVDTAADADALYRHGWRRGDVGRDASAWTQAEEVRPIRKPQTLIHPRP